MADKPPAGMDEKTWIWVMSLSPAWEKRNAKNKENKTEGVHRFGHSNEGISEAGGAIMLCSIFFLVMATLCMIYRVYFMNGKRLSKEWIHDNRREYCDCQKCKNKNPPQNTSVDVPISNNDIQLQI